MPNRLAQENSPYLLQHQDNPVDWYPWGEEALEKAKVEDKPIFLSIGYAACHWCHVMAHESFEDPETASLMNDLFINIKVDREERPDIDGIYMTAVVALTGQGGWPASVFLTPDGEPFYGGTYFPPVPRYNMPSFSEVLVSVSKAWTDDRQNVLTSGQRLKEHLDKGSSVESKETALAPETMEKASVKLAQSYDWRNGGWGQAPKFPQPMAIRFLLHRATGGDKLALDAATHALKAMALGGIYDVIGGGFARYSVDNYWLVPHFEKMLYDNAQLAREYLHAYMITGDPQFKRICEETLDWTLREMTHPQGGFYSSLDADSEGEEGKFYIWSVGELNELLGEDANFLFAAYGVSVRGNFEGHTVLQRAMTNQTLADTFDLAPEDVQAKLDRLHKLLFETRSERIRPETDDKILTAWNAWMMTAFAEAGRYLKREDYLAAAQRNADFLLTELHPKGRLLRSWRAGAAKLNGYLEDYASLVLGLLALYQSDHDPRWFAEAHRLTENMTKLFVGNDGLMYDTGNDHEELVFRPREVQDNATPSGGSLAANALFQMAAYSGNGEWYDLGVKLSAPMQTIAIQHPTAFANWLAAIDFAQASVQEIAIVGDLAEPATKALLEEVQRDYRPYIILAASPVPVSAEAPALLQDRPLLHDQPTAYVCQRFICQQPVNDPAELREQINQI